MGEQVAPTGLTRELVIGADRLILTLARHWLLVANEKQEIVWAVSTLPVIEPAPGQQGGLNQSILYRYARNSEKLGLLHISQILGSEGFVQEDKRFKGYVSHTWPRRQQYWFMKFSFCNNVDTHGQ